MWHLITGEYPPRPGGVSDYTRLIACALAKAGDEVHVWTARDERPSPADRGVTVHRLSDHFGRRGLRELSDGLRQFGPGSRVIVQYVPHMYGYKAMNLGFAAWLRWRAPAYSIMFHEVAFDVSWRQSLKHNVLGIVTRVMARLAANGADRVFISVPYWRKTLSRCLVTRRDLEWLPVPSNVATEVDAAAVAQTRQRLTDDGEAVLVGHFGTYHGPIAEAVAAMTPVVLRRDSRRRAILIGRGSERFARALLGRSPDLRDRVAARDDLSDVGVAEHLAASDLLMQPYPDGVSCRRGSAMAALALGRPIVTTDGISTEPVWREENIVALAPANDPDAFLRQIESLLAAPDERQRLGQRAQSVYAATFSCEKTIAALRGEKRTPA